MDKIRVTTDTLRSYARQLEDCADVLSDAKSRLQNALDSLPESCAKIGAGEKLSKWIRATDASRSNCSKVGSGLTDAARRFEDCDGEIQRSIAAITEAHENGDAFTTTEAVAGETSHWQSSQTTTTDNRNTFDKIKDWAVNAADEILDFFNINEFGRDYEDPGQERERAHDAQMVEQITEIFQDESLNEDAWNNADIEGKREIQREVIRRLNRILNTKASDNIFFYNSNSNQMGVYDHITKHVVVNESHYDDGYEAMMNNIVHEMRHAYQRESMNDPDSYEVSQETAETWKDNFKHYKNVDQTKPISEWNSILDSYTYEEYYNQPVETDARAFAGSVDYGTDD